MAKTGKNNRITEERYYRIKAFDRTPEDDAKAMEMFGIGKSTCRKIRNTQDYMHYLGFTPEPQQDRILYDRKSNRALKIEIAILLIIAAITAFIMLTALKGGE